MGGEERETQCGKQVATPHRASTGLLLPLWPEIIAALLRCHSHTVLFTLSSVQVSGVSTDVLKHHHRQFRALPSPQTLQLSPPSPFPQSPVSLLPTSTNVPVLDVSYKWITYYVAFCVWFLSLSMVFLRFVRVVL